jgi:hypothetical protein
MRLRHVGARGEDDDVPFRASGAVPSLDAGGSCLGGAAYCLTWLLSIAGIVLISTMIVNSGVGFNAAQEDRAVKFAALDMIAQMIKSSVLALTALVTSQHTNTSETLASVNDMLIELKAICATESGPTSAKSVRQAARCTLLDRPWPQDAACASTATMDAAIDNALDTLTINYLEIGGPNLTALYAQAPGYQIAYYSPVCGMYTHTYGVRNLTTGEPMTDETRMPSAYALAFASSATLWKVLETNPSASFNTPLSEYISPATLFATDRHTLHNVAVTPRIPYDAGECFFSGNNQLGNAGYRLYDADSDTFFWPNEIVDAGAFFVEALDNASVVNNQCMMQITANVGLIAIILEQLHDGTNMDIVLENVLFSSAAACGIERTICPTNNGYNSDYAATLDDDWSTLHLGLSNTTISIHNRINSYLGRNCMSTAVEQLKLLHAVLDNEFLGDSARALLDSSFVRCTELWGANAAQNCGLFTNLFQVNLTSSEFWGMPGLTRMARDYNVSTPPVLIEQGSMTGFVGGVGSLIVKHEDIGSYVSVTTNGITGAFGMVADTLAALAVNALMPSFDAAPRQFTQDTTSRIGDLETPDQRHGVAPDPI